MRDFTNKLYNCDNLELIKKLPNNSIDNFITDVPYALCDINGLDMIKNNSNNSGDFMNKKWLLPTVEMLKEFYRVLKTGGFFVTTFTPRQDLQTVFLYRLMEAGFDVSFSPLYFCYKSGFPKASNCSKVIQKNQGVPMEFGEERGYGDNNTKRHGGGNNIHGGVGRPPEDSRKPSYITKPTTPEAIYCDGLYSLSLKPAVEPIIITQKPHGKAKYKQALDWYYERKELLDKGIKEEDLSLYTKNASAGVWIDNGRIPCENKTKFPAGIISNTENNYGSGKGMYEDRPRGDDNNTQGRFPANLLCGFPTSKEELRSEYPKATEEELEKMVNMIENPLDVGRGSKATPNARNNRDDLNKIFKGTINTSYGHDDTGDLSRYFSLTAWSKKHFPNLHNVAEKTLQLQEDVKKTGDCLFVCKPAQSEKNAGLEGFDYREPPASARSKPAEGRENALGNPRQNTNPCVKPISLYNYLIALFSKDGDIILDPFCGSGVTPIACVLTNRKYIGIEMSEEYHKIAEARVEYWKQQKEAVKIPYASKKNISASTTEEGILL